MKKHIIAAAVTAAVAVPAMAQNVSIGGWIDLSPQSERKVTQGTGTSKYTGTGNDYVHGTSQSNRINITGVEDLGGGMKADFLYRLRYLASGGTGGADDYHLRLTTGLGAFKLGTYGSLLDDIGGLTGAFQNANSAGTLASGFSDFVAGSLGTNQASIAAVTGVVTKAAVAGNGAGDISTPQGLFQYTSPVMSGFQAQVEYVNRSSDASAVTGKGQLKQQGLGLAYSAGPLQIKAATGSAEIVGTGIGVTEAAGTGGKTDITWLAGNYDMGAAKLFVVTAKREDKNTAGAKTDDISVNSIGVQVPMGAVTLFASMYDGSDKNTGVAGAYNTEKRDLSGHQLAVRYALSKRTYLYALTGTNKDDGPTAGTLYKRQDTAIGMAHSF